MSFFFFSPHEPMCTTWWKDGTLVTWYIVLMDNLVGVALSLSCLSAPSIEPRVIFCLMLWNFLILSLSFFFFLKVSILFIFMLRDLKRLLELDICWFFQLPNLPVLHFCLCIICATGIDNYFSPPFYQSHLMW